MMSAKTGGEAAFPHDPLTATIWYESSNDDQPERSLGG